MIIDFHTHIFPDKIAMPALNTMRKRLVKMNHIEVPYYEAYPLCTDGTLEGHKQMMKRNHIDISVTLPVATNEGQTDSINRFAESTRSYDIIPFGALYPYQKNWEYVLCDLAERGFKGIKFHPEFQQFYIDGKEGLAILKKAEKLGLIVVLHAGTDPEYPDGNHCTPIRLKHVLEEVKGDNIIAAHLGGMDCFDDVEKYLIDSPLYFDTSYVSKILSPEQYARIIINHGPDKIIFGSDSPWQDPAETLEALEGVGLSDEDMEKILYKNALALLK